MSKQTDSSPIYGVHRREVISTLFRIDHRHEWWFAMSRNAQASLSTST